MIVHPPDLDVDARTTLERCRQPLVTGTSVLGIQFEGGIMLAADNLGSYTLLKAVDARNSSN